MLNMRYLFLVMLPFFAAAVVPWLSPEASPRVALLSVVWGAILAIFTAGFCAGDAAQHLSNKPRLRLQIVASVALVILVVVALALHFLMSPILSIVGVSLGIFMSLRLLRATHYGSLISELDFKFFMKLSWVCIGCLMMLGLSYYRYVNSLV